MSDEIKVSDEQTKEWMSKLSPEDKAELTRQALLKRAIELAQPEKDINWGSLTESEFQAAKAKLGIG